MSKVFKTGLFSLLLWGLSLSVFAQNATLTAEVAVTPANALEEYVKHKDGFFEWEVKESVSLENVTRYQLLLTSQEWRGHVWRHQLTLFVPKQNDYDGALLFITGGSNKEEQPNWSEDDSMWPAMAVMAEKNKAIVSVLKQTPNQPLYGDRTEDELISYTFHNYIADQDYTWPLLFPMVKSAVSAMDAVQEFAEQELDHPVNDFVLSGASKRGWTTWLSAATGDKRIKAIAPMVIDVLNMPVNLQYQLDSYGEYSEQIQDYVNLGIVQSIATEEGKALTTMIDPYSYRDRLTVPKMIFMGTNDEYWTVDAIKHYYQDIPGQNLIHYVPNAGHNLGGGKQALEALSAFFGLTLQDKAYPEVSWEVQPGKKTSEFQLMLEDPSFVEAVLWSADSKDRDFRDEKWTSRNLDASSSSKITTTQAHPRKGFKAFYVDFKYKAPNGGSYTVSTRMFLLGKKGLL